MLPIHKSTNSIGTQCSATLLSYFHITIVYLFLSTWRHCVTVFVSAALCSALLIHIQDFLLTVCDQYHMPSACCVLSSGVCWTVAFVTVSWSIHPAAKVLHFFQMQSKWWVFYSHHESTPWWWAAGKVNSYSALPCFWLEQLLLAVLMHIKSILLTMFKPQRSHTQWLQCPGITGNHVHYSIGSFYVPAVLDCQHHPNSLSNLHASPE